MQLLVSTLMLIELALFHYTAADGPPRAPDGHRRIHFAQINETVILKCPIEITKTPIFVEWWKGNVSLYMTQGYEITFKGFLKMKFVTQNHAGTYTCEGVNGYGSVRVNITLIIDKPENENMKYPVSKSNSAKRTSAPSIVQRPPARWIGGVGGEATFHCVASGQPLPRIFWLRDKELVLQSHNYASEQGTHSSLKLHSLQTSDAGLYECIARNSLGEDTADFTLHITEPPPPPHIISLSPSRAVIQEGNSAAFVCDISSKPDVNVHIKWLKKFHHEMGESQDVNLFRLEDTYYRPLNLNYSVSRNGGVYKSKLLISNVCKGDSGTYVCLALNDAGFNFKNSSLTVIQQTTTSFSKPTQQMANSTSISVATIAVVSFLIMLAIVLLVSHHFHRCKPGGNSRIDTGTVTTDMESLKHSEISIKKSHENFYPTSEIKDQHFSSKPLLVM